MHSQGPSLVWESTLTSQVQRPSRKPRFSEYNKQKTLTNCPWSGRLATVTCEKASFTHDHPDGPEISIVFTKVRKVTQCQQSRARTRPKRGFLPHLVSAGEEPPPVTRGRMERQRYCNSGPLGLSWGWQVEAMLWVAQRPLNVCIQQREDLRC
ncbi:hypothetical protein AFLA_011347 [Aspergillus flavus NRRL3357]|nr:hypothetical protein AFLA_011347 [Aspergillus flavus NRRL3357]